MLLSDMIACVAKSLDASADRRAAYMGGSFMCGCSGCVRHGGALLRQHRTTEVSLDAQDAVRMRAHGSRSDVYMPDLYEDFKVSRGSLRPDWAAHARCGRIVASCPAPGPETTVRPNRSRR